MIADRGNGRIIIVDPAGHIRWQFPVAGSLARGQQFSADDAFLSPDGGTITANEEQYDVVVRIDIATHRIVWQYGHFGVPGSAPGYLHTPDDAYPLANGDVMVADIMNCRVLEIAPNHHIIRQWGRTGVCVHNPPSTFDRPNGDTPLPDGGVLITEIGGSRVVRLNAAGHVVFDVHAPVAYPSDAQLDPNGNVVLADYSSRGQVVSISPTGRLLWRYAPAAGAGRLDHPSLAIPLPNGSVLATDDGRARIVLLDPSHRRIIWQFGVLDRPGADATHLNDPDGLEPVPASVIP